jgi:uncharacterized membrane protein YccC
LTVALALKPDLASVFSRSLQRGAGTAAGLLIGWGALHVPPGPGALIVLAILGGIIPHAVRRSYAWFTVVVTPLVVVLLDFNGNVGPAVLGQRLAHTVIACAIVLIFGYALWPGTWRPPFRLVVANICERLGKFIRRSATSSLNGLPDVGLADDRLQIARTTQSLRAVADRVVGEPESARAVVSGLPATAGALDELLATAWRTAASDGSSIDRRLSADLLRITALELRSRVHPGIDSPIVQAGRAPILQRTDALRRTLAAFHP